MQIVSRYIYSLFIINLSFIFSITILCAAELESNSTTAPSFKEGKDYISIMTPVQRLVLDNKDEVIEFFSYNCPHCNYLEPELEAWLKHKSDKVTFVRIPVIFNSNWDASARAYYVAESLGILDKIHKSLFDAIHHNKRKLNDEEDFAVLFAEHGIDNAIFHKNYKSFQTESNLQRANMLVKLYGVRGVPALFVNGKYEVRSQKFFEVVDFLLSR